MKEIRKESMVKFLKNKNNLLIIVLLGVLLMVIAIPVDTAGTGGKSASGRNDNSSYQTKNTGTGYQAGGTAAYTAAGMVRQDTTKLPGRAMCGNRSSI